VQNNVTTAVDSVNTTQIVDHKVTDVALKTYVVVATFTRVMTVKAVTTDEALDLADGAFGLTASSDDSLNLLNWNAYEAE
jgi:hypothetical protein